MVENIFRQALAGDLVSQWEMFDLMEATWPRLSKNLNELKDGVALMRFEVVPWRLKDEEPTPEAERRARLVDEVLWSMYPQPDRDENGFEDTMKDLLDARGKGISVLEIDWETRRISTGVAWGPRATRWVHPSWYGYGNLPQGTAASPQHSHQLMLRVPSAQSPVSNLQSPISGVRGNFEPFPPGKFLIGVCKNKTGHPLGSAMLHVLGFWWAASNFTAEWFLNNAQVFGQPLRWANYDPAMSDPDKAKLAAMLENMGTASWGMFPSGASMELKEAMKGASDNPQKVLLDCADKVCDLVVLRQTLTSDVGDKGAGSRALGEVHERKEQGVEMACAQWTCKALNQLIRAICEMNFGDTRECPWIRPEEDDSETPADLAEVLVRLNTAGLEPTDDAIPDISDRVGIDVQRKAGGNLPPGTLPPGAGDGSSEMEDGKQPKPEGEEDPEKELNARRQRTPDAADKIARDKAAALAQAFRGVLAPVKTIILESKSREEAEANLARFYADWKPDRVAAVVEEALQVASAAGAAGGVSPRTKAPSAQEIEDGS